MAVIGNQPREVIDISLENNSELIHKQLNYGIPPTKWRPLDNGGSSVDPQNHKRWLPLSPSECPHVGITILPKEISHNNALSSRCCKAMLDSQQHK